MGPVINTITNRCTNLRHLDLSGNSKLPLQGQLALFSTLRQLESINLSNTNTSDRVMSVIGAYCTQLQELDVSSSGVTDLGLNSLASAAPLHQTTTAGQSITKLSVLYSNVTSESAYGCIASMPNLVYFDHPDTLSGVERLLMQCPERAPLPLTTLEGCAGGALKVAAAGCPDCTRLRLEADGDDSLAPALQLTRLTELMVAAPFGLCPRLEELLAVRGAGLTHLTLFGVRTGTELRHCRALRVLVLDECCYTADDPAPPPALAHLEQLRVAVGHSEEPPPAALLRRALASPELTELTLEGCDTITDALLEEALDSGGLTGLRTISLTRCNMVTVQPLLRLVLQCPRLETLHMLECAQLSRRDAGDVRRLAEDSGWRLEVEWQ